MKNDVILVTNDNYLPVLLELLKHAHQSIDVMAYSFAIGSGPAARNGATRKIAEELLRIKKLLKSKIEIRVYLEGARNTSTRNRVTGDYLKAGGIKIKFGATHAKGFSIDGRYVLFGSTNLTNQSILKNNETNLLIDNPKVAKGFAEYFEHLWSGGKHGGVKLPMPLIADGGFKDHLIKLIDTAKSTLDFSIYFFHVTEIETALIRAHKRGVKVRGFMHHHESFALSYVRRTRGTFERMKKAGLRDLHLGPPNLFTHSKYIIKDKSEILLGTGNWLHEDFKIHPQLYIKIKNPKIAAELLEVLTGQIADAED